MDFPFSISSELVFTSTVPSHPGVGFWAWTRGAVTAHSNAVSANVKGRTGSRRRERDGRVGFRESGDIILID